MGRKLTQSEYDQMFTTQFTMKLNNATDSDIIARIQSMPNKQGYLKWLVREDIQRSSGTEPDFLKKMIGGESK